MWEQMKTTKFPQSFSLTSRAQGANEKDKCSECIVILGFFRYKVALGFLYEMYHQNQNKHTTRIKYGDYIMKVAHRYY
jgi:hypothetical protein